MATSSRSINANRLLIAAGITIGIGEAGFFDGIVFHQLLQWHHMFSSVESDMTVAGLELNTIGDGLFHAFDWLMISIGIVLLWQMAKQRVELSTQIFVGALLLGGGLFNVVEGLIDHQILGIHHLKPGPNELTYDLVFLAAGAAVAGVGWVLLSSTARAVEHKMTQATAQKRGFGVFPDEQTLEQALSELKSANFPMEQVSVIARQADQDQVEGAEITDRVGDQKVDSPAGIATDAVNNATWGTVLLGLTSMAIPGVGMVTAAGSLGVALITGVAGAGLGTLAFNNLAGALADLGIPNEQARAYTEHLSRGHYLVSIEGIEEQLHQAKTLLQNQKVQAWNVYNTDSNT
jgi:uncharacterized membrane protein